MASRPEWLVESADQNVEYEIEPDAFDTKNNPSWLTPMQPKKQRRKVGDNELTPLKSSKTERKRRKKYKIHGGNDRLRVLEYKAKRPCCLSCFGILHVTTIIAAILAVVSQFLDLAAVYQHNCEDVWKQMTVSESFDLLQVVALHSYGLVFALLIVLTESSEFEITSRWLKPCHDNIITEKWIIRGLLYNFIGLFALQSGREYVSIILTNPTSTENNVLMFDDPNALALIRYSGVILLFVGVIYIVLGITCCKSLKDLQLREMKKAQEELMDFIQSVAEEGTDKGDGASISDGGGVMRGLFGGGQGAVLVEDDDVELTNRDIFTQEDPSLNIPHWNDDSHYEITSQESPPPYKRDSFHQPNVFVDPPPQHSYDQRSDAEKEWNVEHDYSNDNGVHQYEEIREGGGRTLDYSSSTQHKLPSGKDQQATGGADGEGNARDTSNERMLKFLEAASRQNSNEGNGRQPNWVN